jgi:hypothetical protein
MADSKKLKGEMLFIRVEGEFRKALAKYAEKWTENNMSASVRKIVGEKLKADGLLRNS